ncbi:hypothetical protein BH20ACI2_BH20ACI2_18080 [soil metagenome]
MIRTGNQNSIIVLASLGVYFGLILSGAAPQVLASAAMARQYDVKDEVEFSDELDLIPDDERSEVSTSVQVYVEDVEYFLANLSRLRRQGRFDPRVDTFSVAQNALLPCLHSNRAGRYTPLRFVTSSEYSRSALDYFSREMVYGYSLGDCIRNLEFDGVTAADSRFSVDLDRRSFSVSIAVKKESPQNALDLVRRLESTLRLYSAQKNSDLRKAVLRNTTVKALKDQVFVVTRLPRAGLASLLNA